jgi:hypothetical protein
MPRRSYPNLLKKHRHPNLKRKELEHAWTMKVCTVAHTPPTSKASLMYRFFVVPAVHVSNSWPIRRPNPKLISNRIPITSNKVLYGRPILGVRRSITQIWVSSLLETYLQKGFSFGSYCWRRQKIDIKPFACSATQTWNESCILGNNCWKQSKLVVGMF